MPPSGFLGWQDQVHLNAKARIYKRPKRLTNRFTRIADVGHMLPKVWSADEPDRCDCSADLCARTDLSYQCSIGFAAVRRDFPEAAIHSKQIGQVPIQLLADFVFEVLEADGVDGSRTHRRRNAP